MFNLVVFGAPGSGKGTQSARLINEYGLYHISTGDLLRDHIARGTELGKVAESYISKGQLIPDKLMTDILSDVLDNNPETAKGVIFDGFPRTIPQAHSLKEMLRQRDMQIDAVIGLEVDDSELTDRLIKRGKDSGRSDDNPETIAQRLQVYHSQTTPLRDYYVAEGNYHSIPGSGSIEQIFHHIKEALAEPHRKSREAAAKK